MNVCLFGINVHDVWLPNCFVGSNMKEFVRLKERILFVRYISAIFVYLFACVMLNQIACMYVCGQ